MNWYYAEAGQQKGPVTEEQLTALAQSGTIQADTLVWREGMDNWKPYAEVLSSAPTPAPLPAPLPAGPPPENAVVCAQCGNMFGRNEVIRYGDQWVCGTCKPFFVQRLREGAPLSVGTGPNVTLEELLNRDYEVDIGATVRRAWDLFAAVPGPIIGVTLLIVLAMLIANLIPYLNLILPLAITGPLIGGLWHFFIKRARNESSDLGVAFGGFGAHFGQLVLTHVVSGILSTLWILPFFVVMFAGLMIGLAGRDGGGADVSMLGPAMMILGILFLVVGMLGSIYFTVCWMFALPLVIDKGLAFWPAMRLSRAMVRKHWGMTFLLLIVAGLITLVGLLACIVGLLVAWPVAFAALSCHYQRVFGDLAPQSK